MSEKKEKKWAKGVPLARINSNHPIAKFYNDTTNPASPAFILPPISKILEEKEKEKKKANTSESVETPKKKKSKKRKKSNDAKSDSNKDSPPEKKKKKNTPDKEEEKDKAVASLPKKKKKKKKTSDLKGDKEEAVSPVKKKNKRAPLKLPTNKLESNKDEEEADKKPSAKVRPGQMVHKSPKNRQDDEDDEEDDDEEEEDKKPPAKTRIQIKILGKSPKFPKAKSNHSDDEIALKEYTKPNEYIPWLEDSIRKDLNENKTFNPHQIEVLKSNGYCWPPTSEPKNSSFLNPILFFTYLPEKARNHLKDNFEYHLRVPESDVRAQKWDDPNFLIHFPPNEAISNTRYFDESGFDNYKGCCKELFESLSRQFRDFCSVNNAGPEDMIQVRKSVVNNFSLLRLLRYDNYGYLNTELVNFYINWSHRKREIYNNRSFIFPMPEFLTKAKEDFFNEDTFSTYWCKIIVLRLWSIIHPATYYKYKRAVQQFKSKSRHRYMYQTKMFVQIDNVTLEDKKSLDYFKEKDFIPFAISSFSLVLLSERLKKPAEDIRDENSEITTFLQNITLNESSRGLLKDSVENFKEWKDKKKDNPNHPCAAEICGYPDEDFSQVLEEKKVKSNFVYTVIDDDSNNDNNENKINNEESKEKESNLASKVENVIEVSKEEALEGNIISQEEPDSPSKLSARIDNDKAMIVAKNSFGQADNVSWSTQEIRMDDPASKHHKISSEKLNTQSTNSVDKEAPLDQNVSPANKEEDKSSTELNQTIQDDPSHTDQNTQDDDKEKTSPKEDESTAKENSSNQDKSNAKNDQSQHDHTNQDDNKKEIPSNQEKNKLAPSIKSVKRNLETDLVDMDISDDEEDKKSNSSDAKTDNNTDKEDNMSSKSDAEVKEDYLIDDDHAETELDYELIDFQEIERQKLDKTQYLGYSFSYSVFDTSIISFPFLRNDHFYCYYLVNASNFFRKDIDENIKPFLVENNSMGNVRDNPDHENANYIYWILTMCEHIMDWVKGIEDLNADSSFDSESHPSIQIPNIAKEQVLSKMGTFNDERVYLHKNVNLLEQINGNDCGVFTCINCVAPINTCLTMEAVHANSFLRLKKCTMQFSNQFGVDVKTKTVDRSVWTISEQPIIASYCF